MRRTSRPLTLVVSAIASVLVAFPGLAASHAMAASGGAASPCLRGSPAATVCQRALGVALVPPAGWRVTLPSAAEPEGLTLVSHGISRLSIFPLAIVSPKYEACAVASAAAILAYIAANGAIIQRTPVRLGHEPAILLSGFRGIAANEILVGHQGGVMRVVLYGRTIAADQRAVLRTIRFIPRFRPFPRPGAAPPPALGAALAACAGGPPRLVFTGVMPFSPLTVNMIGSGFPRHTTLTVVLHWSGTPRPGAPKPRYTRYVSYESPRTDAWACSSPRSPCQCRRICSSLTPSS